MGGVIDFLMKLILFIWWQNDNLIKVAQKSKMPKCQLDCLIIFLIVIKIKLINDYYDFLAIAESIITIILM